MSDDDYDEEREREIHFALRAADTQDESFQLSGSYTRVGLSRGSLGGKTSSSSNSAGAEEGPEAQASDELIPGLGNAPGSSSVISSRTGKSSRTSSKISAGEASDEGDLSTDPARAGARDSVFATEKFQNMQGFIKESEMKERVKHFGKYITAVELRNLRNSFSRVDRITDGVEYISGDSLKKLFSFLSIEASEKLMEAIKSDCSQHASDRYDFADVVAMYIALKKIEYIKLPSSKTWAESKPLKAALLTKNYLSDNPPRTLWNAVMLLLALAQWMIVLYRDGATGFHRPRLAGYITFDFVCSILIAVDVWLWANTVVAERGRVSTIDSTAKIRQRYLRTWLFPDVLAALPFDALLSSIGGDGASIASGCFSHLRMIRIFRTLTFWTISGHIPTTTAYIIFYSTLLPLLKLIVVIVVLLHTATVIFWRLKIATGNVADLTESPYIGAMYFIVQTFSTVGFGDIALRTQSELWFTIFVVFFALLINGLIIGKLVSMLQQQSATSRREDRLRETLAVLEFFEIPKQLQSEILNFQQHVLWTKAPTAFNDVTEPLPKGMVDNIDIIRRIGVVVTVPLFADASEAVLVQFARSLIARTSKPEEYVTCSSDTHQGIRWLLFGYVDCLDAHGRYNSTLKTGEAFGFEGLLECADEVYNYKALSYCDLLVCPADDFHRILSAYPAFSRHVWGVLDNRRDSVSDQSSTIEHLRRKSSVSDQHGKPRIVALRNLHTKLRLYKECLEATKASLLKRGSVDEAEAEELEEEEGEDVVDEDAPEDVVSPIDYDQ